LFNITTPKVTAQIYSSFVLPSSRHSAGQSGFISSDPQKTCQHNRNPAVQSSSSIIARETSEANLLEYSADSQALSFSNKVTNKKEIKQSSLFYSRPHQKEFNNIDYAKCEGPTAV